jgi:hypothetical protein
MKEVSKKIKKHNSLTDGYLPISAGRAVLPDKLINALYWKYEKEGNIFNISLLELRNLLGLKHGKDDERIYKALLLLQTPMQVRNFNFKGREILWMSASFLNDVTRWKDNQNYLEIEVSAKMVEALKQKTGYTPIELKICNQFKTKYGLKLYEMYLRYYSLPNKEGKGVGKISKTLDEMNSMFSANYQQPSKLLNMKYESKTIAPINRGLNEIEKITDVIINCFYNKIEKTFIFGWEQIDNYPSLRIPYKRIEELIDWYLYHRQDKLKIKSLPKYRQTLKSKIINDEFEELDALYCGMIKHKYNLKSEDYYNVKTGIYKDFKGKL